MSGPRLLIDACVLFPTVMRAMVLEAAATRVLAEARRLSDADWQMRPLLKKARLPRLAKALG